MTARESPLAKKDGQDPYGAVEDDTHCLLKYLQSHQAFVTHSLYPPVPVVKLACPAEQELRASNTPLTGIHTTST